MKAPLKNQQKKIYYNNGMALVKEVTDKLEIIIEGAYDVSDVAKICVNIFTIKEKIDITKSANYLFSSFKGDNLDEILQYNDTENAESANDAFSYTNLTKLPLLNFEKCKEMDRFLFWSDKINEIPSYNLRSISSLVSAFLYCYNLTSFLAYGMRTSFSIRNCTLMEAPALVTVLSNCQVVTSTKTLTLGSTLLAKLENVYVKETGVELYEGITCRPCVICESTDEGAMLATEYFTRKGWTIV